MGIKTEELAETKKTDDKAATTTSKSVIKPEVLKNFVLQVAAE